METILHTLLVIATGAFVAIVLVVTFFGSKILAVVVPIVARGLAEGKFFGRKNFGFTILDEAQCKVIKSMGRFERVIMVYEGFGLDQYWNIRPSAQDGEIVGWTKNEAPKTNADTELERTGHWDESKRKYIAYEVSMRPIEEGGNYVFSERIGEDGKPTIPTKETTVDHYPGRIPTWMPKFISKHLPGGIWWIGNPFTHAIHEYNFQWTSLRQKGEAGTLKDEFVFRDLSSGSTSGPIDYANTNDDIYWARIEDAETNDPIPVGITFGLTIRIVNPYKALFRVEQWLEATLDRTMPAVRSWVAQQPYVKAIATQETTRREADLILSKTDIDEYVERHWGVRIKALNIKNIDPKDEALRDITTAEYRGKMEGKAAAAKAAGEAEAFTTFANAVEGQPQGQMILAARTLQEMSKNPASTIVHSPQMAGLLLNVPTKTNPPTPEDKKGENSK